MTFSRFPLPFQVRAFYLEFIFTVKITFALNILFISVTWMNLLSTHMDENEIKNLKLKQHSFRNMFWKGPWLNRNSSIRFQLYYKILLYSSFLSNNQYNECTMQPCFIKIKIMGLSDRNFHTKSVKLKILVLITFHSWKCFA